MKRHRRLSKSEMAGFILLLLVIILTVVVVNLKDRIYEKPDHLTKLKSEEILELSAFSQKIRIDSINRRKHQDSTFSKRKAKPISPVPFDPNTADSALLAGIGLKSWQINNILKYRSKGGKWKNPEDFSKLYGLSTEEFEQLRPYIYIKKDEKQLAREKAQQRKDSLFRTYPQKFDKITVLPLDSADTTLLKKIPGIGSYYARKICSYRERLGGFCNVGQLKEIEGLPKHIEEWFQLPANPTIRKTSINKTDFKGLVRHPYLNYEQVKAICNYIRKYGEIKSWDELSNSEQFTEKDIQRLKPYITFE